MKNKCGLWLVAGAILCGALSGCASYSTYLAGHAGLSPLEIRAIQTRTYDGQDAKATLKGVMNVLQDEGFLIDFGNTDLGLLRASRGSFGALEATVNVSEFGKQTRVRVSFGTLQYADGGRTFTRPVQVAAVYQDFFVKLERGFFIQKQGL